MATKIGTESDSKVAKNRTLAEIAVAGAKFSAFSPDMIVSTRRLRLIQMETTKSSKRKTKKERIGYDNRFPGFGRLEPRDVIVQHHDPSGNLIVESTDFPACTPSIVVCDRLLKDRPGSRVFAKIS